MINKKETPDYMQAAQAFEKKWSKYWYENNIFKTPVVGAADFDTSKPKKVILDFFPYPSGAGLHIGHPLGYTATDIISRCYRMQGYNVLHSMGYDSFGLPAEQYAIQTGKHPRLTTDENVKTFTRELRALGFDHDEDSRFLSSNPDYYHWTQWLFLKMFDSYYDVGEVWTDSFGNKIQGKAKPIAELREKLKSGEWKKDALGEVAPADEKRFNIMVPSEDIEKTVEENRLAVLKNVDVNWCPKLGTVLANEEVTSDGRSERGDYPVYKKPLKQWVLRITCYADRLFNDLQLIDWPKGVIEMQKEWIGPSNGAIVAFTADDGSKLNVYTTRPDTLPGVTFVAVAPEHPLAVKYAGDEAKKMVSLARNHAYDDKSAHNGIFTGQYVTHPLTSKKVPVWVGDYVLSGYGEGAVMGVPSHDERDFAFAKKFGIAIEPVIQPNDEWLKENSPESAKGKTAEELKTLYLADCGSFKNAFVDDGVLLPNLKGAEEMAGMPNRQAIEKICDKLEALGKGAKTKTYKLRDWLFSRQRYWGEPFPVVYDENGKVYEVDESCLPVTLPEVNDFKPVTSDDVNANPVTPLGRVSDWVKVKGIVTDKGSVKLLTDGEENPTAKEFIRDTNTMPNWAGSCWYYMRYFSPACKTGFVDSAAEKYWTGGGKQGGVDLYVGGAEHAVLHLLYARFWHKVFYDLGLVSTPEPFYKLFNQGMITADAYADSRGFYVDVHDVEEKIIDGKRKAFNKNNGEELEIIPGKMGKRYKNGVAPEEICQRHTVDAFRCYMMFLGPLEATSPWREAPIVGMERFIGSVWRLAHRDEYDESSEVTDKKTEVLLNQTIKQVTENIQDIRLNTAISALMVLTNTLSAMDKPKKEYVDILLRLMNPFTPFMVEEIYSEADAFKLPEGVKSAAFLPWPKYDDSKLASDEVLVVVQVNGKKRAEFNVSADCSNEEIEKIALSMEAVKRYTDGHEIKRIIHIPNKTYKGLGIVVA